jgi:5'-3' exonuclease
MGIKHFFSWFKKHFLSSIYYVNNDLKTEAKVTGIDNLIIDMNGIFHTSAQKIYEYGSFKPNARLLGIRRIQKQGGIAKQVECYKDVCKTLDEIIDIVKPNKRVVLCVDGPAPLSKQDQQRKRRFMSSLERENSQQSFDSNSITPGTKFMHFLTKYIDWHLRKKISENDPNWSRIEVIFSNEKAPGEGEHKGINFIRKMGSKSDSYCIFGMDADLIMLALGTHIPNFYILREEPMSSNFKYYLIHIKTVREELGHIMKWEGKKEYNLENAIDDFIFMCFTVGNDFLPHIPSIEIIEGGLEIILDVYKNTSAEYGHLTRTSSKGIRFKRKALKAFLGTISQYEKISLENKLMHKDKFFPDLLLEKHSRFSEGKYELDLESYKSDYYSEKLSEEGDLEKLCHNYLEGMQWVMSYYISGVPCWKWRYPYHYGPFASTIAEHVSSFKFKTYDASTSTVPFVQLLCVLPSSSSNLLPIPLNDLLSEDSPISDYCPKKFDVDLSGKRQTWEATVLLPIVNYDRVEKYYFEKVRSVNEQDRKRNSLGKTFVYSKSNKKYEFKSYYGDFSCDVKVDYVDL